MSLSQQPPPMPKQPFERWAEVKQTDPITFAAVRASTQWPQGFEVTESEFEQAVQLFMKGVVR